MRFSRMINVVGVPCRRQAGRGVITGGVLDVPGRTVFEKMRHLEAGDGWLRLFLQEPRDRITQCVNLVVPATDSRANVGFVIIESDYYVPMPASNTICTVTALLELGMLPMQEPETKLVLEAPAGLVPVTAQCRDGKCVSVSVDNLPAFVFVLGKAVEVPGLGTISVDVAAGGMISPLVGALRLASSLSGSEGADLVAVGERIKAAAAGRVRPCTRKESTDPHDQPDPLRGASAPEKDREKRARNAVVVSPGRLGRSPCGTGTSRSWRSCTREARSPSASGSCTNQFWGPSSSAPCSAPLPSAAAPASRPAITGSGWITAFHRVCARPRPIHFRASFKLGDTWPGEGRKPPR